MGFIGRGLVLRLQRRGLAVVAWVRSPHRARAQLGEDVPLPSLEAADQELADVLSQFETVINLAGEPLFGKRRTPGRKRAIVESGVA
jgi:NAD dependent epimerase/dehydratase family enzyme